jgi:hypothetical protein
VVKAKWIMAVPAFATALFWNYCALICTNPDSGEPSTLGHLAGTSAVFALLLSGAIGVWIVNLRRQLPNSVSFVVGAVTALMIGPALAAAQSPTMTRAFERGAIEGALVSLLGISLMVRALLHTTIIVAQPPHP